MKPLNFANSSRKRRFLLIRKALQSDTKHEGILMRKGNEDRSPRDEGSWSMLPVTGAPKLKGGRVLT
jgi:hypothetical protein